MNMKPDYLEKFERETFKWFEGGFFERLVQFCCYVAAALFVYNVFKFIGLVYCNAWDICL